MRTRKGAGQGDRPGVTVRQPTLGAYVAGRALQAAAEAQVDARRGGVPTVLVVRDDELALDALVDGADELPNNPTEPPPQPPTMNIVTPAIVARRHGLDETRDRRAGSTVVATPPPRHGRL